jgi:hypothetical protein
VFSAEQQIHVSKEWRQNGHVAVCILASHPSAKNAERMGHPLLCVIQIPRPEWVCHRAIGAALP